MKLFCTAFLQVFLVAANTYFISQLFYPGVLIAGFFISWLWTGNVKRISISGNKDRFIYAFGASLGGVAGMTVSKLLFNK